MRRPYLLGVLVTLLAIVASAQLTVDATGATRERKRPATTGGGGGIGRKASLRLSIEVLYPSSDGDGKTVVEFTLTNSGNEQLEIPVSPNPGDLEPEDPKEAYTVTTLALRIDCTKAGKTETVRGGANLFGSVAFPGTSVPLAPGESIRVLAKVLFPPAQAVETSFVAYAGLGSESIKTVGGRTTSMSHEIGYALSQPYTATALFGAGGK